MRKAFLVGLVLAAGGKPESRIVTAARQRALGLGSNFTRGC